MTVCSSQVNSSLCWRTRIRHSLEFREGLELGAAKVVVARTFFTFFDVFRTTNFDAARRFKCVEIAPNNDILGFTLLQYTLDFAAMTSFVADQPGTAAVTAQSEFEVLRPIFPFADTVHLSAGRARTKPALRLAGAPAVAALHG